MYEAEIPVISHTEVKHDNRFPVQHIKLQSKNVKICWKERCCIAKRKQQAFRNVYQKVIFGLKFPKLQGKLVIKPFKGIGWRVNQL